MISSLSFLSSFLRRPLRLSALLLSCAALMCCPASCGTLEQAVKKETAPPSTPEGKQRAVPGGEKQEPALRGAAVASLAVFPFENLSGSAVPLKSIRTSLSEELRQ